MEKYFCEFEIPCPTSKDLPRTLNNSIHGAKYFTWERSKWRRLIPKYQIKYPDIPLKRARLTLTRCSNRQPDFDNMVMSWKFVIDALVKCGILSDDNHKVIGIPNYIWEPTKRGAYKIKIKVEEID